jgi:amino acid permease
MLTDSNRLIVIPLSFLRRLDSLKYTSVIALVAIGYLIILVIAHFIKGDTLVDRGEVHVFTWQGPVQALASFPVIVFAYTCHQNVRPYPTSLPGSILR